MPSSPTPPGPLPRSSGRRTSRALLWVAFLSGALLAGGPLVACDDGEGAPVDATRDAGFDGTIPVPDRALPPAFEPEPEPDADPSPDAEPPCVVGSGRCEDIDTFATCLRDRTWGTRDCAEGQICQAGQCVVPLCPPDAFECLPGGEVRRCAPDGDRWSTYACPEGVPCRDRDCGVCTPGEPLCTADDMVRICTADGAWGPQQPCPNATACTAGHCVREACITRVLLLVDRSGSMGGAWSGVSASINAVLTDHPEVYFGMAAFPSTASGCGLGGVWPQVPIGVRGRDAIADWLAATEPRGNTPLVSALSLLERRRADVFGVDRPGHVVVLSDGQDSCACQDAGEDEPCAVDALTASTRALLDAGVQTHVIGYAFGEDPSQIDAIAAAGGGPHDRHLAAGDEAALREVFDALVDDIKLCP